VRLVSRIRGRRLRHRRSSADAVVLVYHRIGPPGTAGGGLTVQRSRFAEQLQALRAQFRPLHLADLVEALTGGVIPRRSVAITFDDGYLDNLHEAKPLLETHGLPATVFVVSGYVGSGRRFWWDELERVCFARPDVPGRVELEIGGTKRSWRVVAGAERRDLYRSLRDAFGPLEEAERDELLVQLRAWSGVGEPAELETLTADQLLQLADGGLIEIGAHTITHPRLSAVPRDRQLEEIRGSMRQLRELLDRDVLLFSYPFGAHDRTAAASARAAGVACACTIAPQGVSASTDRYRLPRLPVDDWSGDELIEQVSAQLT
jgi:peptidoglycan/xylan/chitin deacetylase (PgdA/CDA1 family)